VLAFKSCVRYVLLLSSFRYNFIFIVSPKMFGSHQKGFELLLWNHQDKFFAREHKRCCVFSIRLVWNHRRCVSKWFQNITWLAGNFRVAPKITGGYLQTRFFPNSPSISNICWASCDKTRHAVVFKKVTTVNGRHHLFLIIKPFKHLLWHIKPGSGSVHFITVLKLGAITKYSSAQSCQLFIAKYQQY